jgi:AcrR family transcriptional regulator
MAKDDIIRTSAEKLFEQRGFSAVPIDVVIEAAGVSPRTMYKHFASKNALAASVLRARQDRFLTMLDRANDGAGLLEALRVWLKQSPEARGCLFLRAEGEFGHSADTAVITAAVSEYRHDLQLICDRKAGGPEAGRRLRFLVEGAAATAAQFDADTAVDTALELWRLTQT